MQGNKYCALIPEIRVYHGKGWLLAVIGEIDGLGNPKLDGINYGNRSGAKVRDKDIPFIVSQPKGLMSNGNRLDNLEGLFANDIDRIGIFAAHE